MDYLDEEIVREETRRIIQLGQWIGFVGEDKGKYYIRTRSRKADVREAELKNAWIEWQIKRDEEKEIEPLLIPLQNKYVEERKKRPRVTEF